MITCEDVAYNPQHILLVRLMWSSTWKQPVFLRFMSIVVAAVKMKNGVVVDKFEKFVDPGHPLSATTIQCWLLMRW